MDRIVLREYTYVGRHPTVVKLEAGKRKVPVKPREKVTSEFKLPSHLFKTYEDLEMIETNKHSLKEEKKQQKLNKAQTEHLNNNTEKIEQQAHQSV